jgi:hypothetical protein
MQHNDAEEGAPHAQLSLPVPDGGDRRHYNARLVKLAMREAAQERNKLYRLSQAHLIPHDACGSMETVALPV